MGHYTLDQLIIVLTNIRDTYRIGHQPVYLNANDSEYENLVRKVECREQSGHVVIWDTRL